MPDQHQPRRRQTDRDRRRWPDSALDQQDERIDEHDKAFEDARRRLSELRRDVTDVRVDVRDEAQRNAEFRREQRAFNDKVEKWFAQNFREHESVLTTANDIKRTVEPTRWSKAKDFATFISVLIVPFLLTYLTIVLAGGAR